MTVKKYSNMKIGVSLTWVSNFSNYLEKDKLSTANEMQF